MSDYAIPPHPLTPNPTGWFAVAMSDELASGQVQPVRCLGRELVLFRTARGVASLLDAYCVHLGTDLGHGGTVEGECLRCPFHHWAYGVDGSCVDIPYASRIPKNAKMRSYPLAERNGVLLGWFHPEGAPPTYEIPEFPREGWSEPTWLNLEFEMHIQEVAENGIDIAHFAPVHSSTRARVRVHDPRSIPFHFTLETAYPGDGIGVPGRSVDVATDWNYYGVGVFCGVSTAPEFGTQVRHLFHFTPVPDNRLIFRVALSANLSTIPQELVELVHERNAEITVHNLEEDAPIWRRKRYLTQPVLCDGDGPYGLLRRWTQQFFATEVAVPDVPVDRDDGVYGLHGAPLPPDTNGQAEPFGDGEPVADGEAAPVADDLSRESVRAIIFERMPSVFNAAAVDQPFVVQYEIGGEHGGEYFIEIETSCCRPGEGHHHDPTLRVAIQDRDWVDLNRGVLDGAQAFMTERLRVDGDLSLAMKLAQAFPIDPAPR